MNAGVDIIRESPKAPEAAPVIKELPPVEKKFAGEKARNDKSAEGIRSSFDKLLQQPEGADLTDERQELDQLNQELAQANSEAQRRLGITTEKEPEMLEDLPSAIVGNLRISTQKRKLLEDIKSRERSKKPITEETKEWSSDLDTQLPINGEDLPGFKAWIDWNGFQLNRETGGGHEGFDFAAYLTTDNKIVVGLPASTKIRAVADGEVRQIVTVGGYGTQIGIEHGAYDSGMFSTYIHVKPLVEEGVTVKKGDVVAELYKDEGDKDGRLVHLHLALRSGWGTRDGDDRKLRAEDPVLIDNSIYEFKAEPQGSSNFTVPQLPNAEIEIANFERVRFNQQIAHRQSTQPVTKAA